MNLAFMAAATGLIAAATTLLVSPTLRSAPAPGQPRGSLAWVAAIVVLLPLGALGLYLVVGTPAALDHSAYERPAAPSPVDDAIARLQANARRQPNDLPSWLLLGRAAATMQKPEVALEAFGHALKVAPDNPDVMVAYAEAVAVKHSDHRLDNATRAVLERALRIEPRHQHGLLLLGVADYQDGRFADAASRWKQLLAVLPPGSGIAAAIEAQIADAEARISGDASGNAASPLARQR